MGEGDGYGCFCPTEFLKMTLLSSENELAHDVPKNRVNRTVTTSTKKLKFLSLTLLCVSVNHLSQNDKMQKM